MRIAACIVLFHPDPKDLERDILSHLPFEVEVAEDA